MNINYQMIVASKPCPKNFCRFTLQNDEGHQCVFLALVTEDFLCLTVSRRCRDYQSAEA